MASGRAEEIQAVLKKAVAVLRESEVPFLVGGGLAVWARGGPESGHDIDVMVKREHAQRALEALAEAGFRPEQPPEGWLYKAWYDDDVFVDIIFHPSGMEVTDEVLGRGEHLQVMALPMPVMALEDVLVTKLAAIREHSLRYDSVLEIARSLREKIDWDDVRRRAPDNPYVRAFFTLVEGLGIVPPASGVQPPAREPMDASPGDTELATR